MPAPADLTLWSLRLRIVAYYCAMFGLVGIFLPFFPVWLESRGLTAAEIGLVMSAILWVRVISNPLAAQIADRRGERRRLVTLLSLLGALTAALYLGAWGFWPIVAVALLHTAVQSPVMPLSENLILLTLRERRLDYGRLRAWGSVAFIVTSMGAGALLEGSDPVLIMPLIVGGLLLVTVTCSTLPDARPPPATGTGWTIGELLTNRLFLLFVVCAALNMASHAVLHAFASLHWRAAGVPEAMIGVLWAVGVVAEIVLFAFSGVFLRRLGVGGMLCLGAAAGIVRWIGLGLTTEVWALVPIQALHGLTFGASHLGAMHFIQQAVPPRLSATAQGLYSAISMGLFVGATTAFSGVLYETLGGGAFHVMALYSAASLAVALVLTRLWAPGREIA